MIYSSVSDMECNTSAGTSIKSDTITALNTAVKRGLQRVACRKGWRQSNLVHSDTGEQVTKRMKLNRSFQNENTSESCTISKFTTEGGSSIVSSTSDCLKGSLPKRCPSLEISRNKVSSDSVPSETVPSIPPQIVVSRRSPGMRVSRTVPRNVYETNYIHGNIKNAANLERKKGKMTQNLNAHIQHESTRGTPQPTSSAGSESEYFSSSHASMVAMFGDPNILPHFTSSKDSISRSSNPSQSTRNYENCLCVDSVNLVMQEDNLAEEERPLLVSNIRKIRTELWKQKMVISNKEWFLQMNTTDKESIIAASTDSWREWYIVLDTNIFLSNLSYVQELCSTNFKNLGFPVLVIPWQVVQELDRLEDCDNPNMASKACRAVQYLKANFLAKHPRIRVCFTGQTLLEANPKWKYNADDTIVCCCTKLSETGRVVLLSNDKTLHSKATAKGVEALVLEDMEKFKSSEGVVDTNKTNCRCEFSTDSSNVSSSNKSFTSLMESPGSATIMCRLEVHLKELLSYRLLQCCSTSHTELDTDKGSVTAQLNNDREVGINNVLVFFNKIWTTISTFCGTMCELMNIEHNVEYIKPHPTPSMTEIQNQMPEIFPFVRDLLHHIDSIFEISIVQLSPEHQVVCDLYNIISSYLLSLDNDLEETISPKYIMYFCSCPKTRQMLDVARKTFQEYLQLLNKGIYYLVNT